MAGDAQIPKIVCLSDCPTLIFYFNCRKKHEKNIGTKPIDTNGTPEGKENNRRVEFAKM